MIFPDVDLETWCNKIGIDPEDAECSCGKKGKTTVPIITKDWIGLSMPKCTKCGDIAPGLLVTARSPEMQIEMLLLINNIDTKL